MGDGASTRERPSYGSPRAAAIYLTPIVFAAVLAACSTKAQTRGAAQTTTVQAPPPAAAQSAPAPEAPATPDAQAEAEAAAPAVASKEGGSGDAQADAVAPETYAEEAPAPPEEPVPQQFTDSTAPAPDDEPLAQQPFADEQPAQDESSTTPEHFADEAPAMDDESVPPPRFTDEEAPAPNDSVAARERFSDEAPAREEDIVAQQQFSDEAAPAQDEVSPPPVFKDEVAEAAPEEPALPQTFTDEAVAQADPAKPSPATLLPLTISVEADSLFDFDRSSIRPDSRHNLDELVAKLEGVGYGEVIAVGFADPIGNDKYNQRLSERRATSVKHYLISKGIPADRIKAEGRGRTEEYASYKSCGGLRKQKLIACLQPNRRVEITVTAQQ
jgi:OOP family OmpA-OmpF porin